MFIFCRILTLILLTIIVHCFQQLQSRTSIRLEAKKIANLVHLRSRHCFNVNTSSHANSWITPDWSHSFRDHTSCKLLKERTSKNMSHPGGVSATGYRCVNVLSVQWRFSRSHWIVRRKTGLLRKFESIFLRHQLSNQSAERFAELRTRQQIQKEVARIMRNTYLLYDLPTCDVSEISLPLRVLTYLLWRHEARTNGKLVRQDVDDGSGNNCNDDVKRHGQQHERRGRVVRLARFVRHHHLLAVAR